MLENQLGLVTLLWKQKERWKESPVQVFKTIFVVNLTQGCSDVIFMDMICSKENDELPGTDTVKRVVRGYSRDA